jgi:sugar O-acyltransferase (sialic acid O-acetyltransferase NeuD family)
MIIVGAKGFAKQLVEIFFQSSNSEVLFFYDDISDPSDNTLFKLKILKNLDEALFVFRTVSKDFCLGVGGPKTRKTLCEKFENIEGNLKSVISPYAHLSRFAGEIGLGSNILTGAVIENDTSIGKGVLINVNAVIHHDVNIGDFSEVSPGAKILGNVNIGDECLVGSNAVVLPNLNIGNNVIIGAGAVVTRDISSNKVVVGVPAKELKRNE